MPLITWSNDYSVNIKEMDEQRKKLVELINYLDDEVKAHKGMEAAIKVVNELMDYVDVHFKSEEELMEQHGYTEYARQKSQHEDLLQKVSDIQQMFYMREIVAVTNLTNLLQEWLVNHICLQDKKYGAYLNSKGIK